MLLENMNRKTFNSLPISGQAPCFPGPTETPVGLARQQHTRGQSAMKRRGDFLLVLSLLPVLDLLAVETLTRTVHTDT